MNTVSYTHLDVYKRQYVCNMLSREGYRNMKAYHLSTAKKHLQQATDNDIVVADLRLPDGSGIDLSLIHI